MRFKYKVYKLENDEWIFVKEFKDEMSANSLKKAIETINKKKVKITKE